MRSDQARPESASRAARPANRAAPPARNETRHAFDGCQRRSGATTSTNRLRKTMPWAVNQPPRNRKASVLCGAAMRR